MNFQLASEQKLHSDRWVVELVALTLDSLWASNPMLGTESKHGGGCAGVGLPGTFSQACSYAFASYAGWILPRAKRLDNIVFAQSKLDILSKSSLASLGHVTAQRNWQGPMYAQIVVKKVPRSVERHVQNDVKYQFRSLAKKLLHIVVLLLMTAQNQE